MNIVKAIQSVLVKDLVIEFRNKYVLGGIVLYVFSSVLVIYFALQYSNSLQGLNPVVWSVLFWLIILFSSVNAIANSFFREPEHRFYYYYYTLSPQAVIIAKLIYNFLFTVLLSALTFIIFSVMVSNPVSNYPVFVLAVILGGTGYSFLFTTMSAIAGRAGNNATLLAVLGFPLVIPMLIFLTRLSASAIGETGFSDETIKNLLLLGAFNLVLPTLALVLFPYIWRD
ncbi:MAG TPA: heme exporter protein CcmB [Chitinophagales bacterium]|nr:heme exporter protein CcmB [Chitinophagales bacterium]